MSSEVDRKEFKIMIDDDRTANPEKMGCVNCNVQFFNSGKNIYQAKENGIYFLSEACCNRCERGRWGCNNNILEII